MNDISDVLDQKKDTRCDEYRNPFNQGAEVVEAIGKCSKGFGDHTVQYLVDMIRREEYSYFGYCKRV